MGEYRGSIAAIFRGFFALLLKKSPAITFFHHHTHHDDKTTRSPSFRPRACTALGRVQVQNIPRGGYPLPVVWLAR
jgi:hypothetical protein